MCDGTIARSNYQIDSKWQIYPTFFFFFIRAEEASGALTGSDLLLSVDIANNTERKKPGFVKLWEPEMLTAAAELFLASIMICATFRDSDESLNLVRGKKTLFVWRSVSKKLI